ncbi:unnamed protein product [Ilex paraguariensis]|uniref:MraW methylase family protein n=1 Tax=Ilex paraguariensis TaxID=185542 RepID=A0ABC8SUU0_9AQUA
MPSGSKGLMFLSPVTTLENTSMAASAPAVLKKLLFHSLSPPPPIFHLLRRLSVNNFTTTTTSIPTQTLNSNKKKREKQKRRNSQTAAAAESLVKRRTRSDKEFDEESVLRFGDSATHIPVMLGEVLEVFASRTVLSFVDCTLGAAGHSSAIIQAHPEIQLFVGLDVDPVAHEKAQARIKAMLHGNSFGSTPDLGAHILLRNFKDIKSVLCEVDEKMVVPGADGVLMDLGMSSMQEKSMVN